ncbi:unnamed protein product [Lathyrus oleraceus]|uniref:Uncharacterized protein n=2 Tax=Pisum sativum TaxID=3888 RepID=A0A9D5A8A8_PEA|nr:uncharacterized protein LOC127092379 isoform X1 [Pisum sativum]XP_050887198.1 uncharacterized protein LOC127092379 isoform X1 [Pisum sativum]KAI5396185.1 hypothetical protein KIW84_062403 [Pisum sativum]
MEKKRKIMQYRERLDRTLASDDLTNVEILKKLVKSQLLPSSELEDEGYKEKLIERKTAEISNFLDMLRSASDDGGLSNTPHNDWKLKQDSDEFRVMYRQGLEGTPFHTMLVEGFVDGPVDVCLCISWQTSLYKKWWPQSTIPTFKILSSECLQKVQIGEQISLVRMKVSWPLSMREAVVHYYLFEYFQEDLVVVLTNSVPDSKSVAETLSSFNDEAIPEANDVVRIDLVGGFALQKCTPERSYFRTIANMDVKVDFVPPSLINFISRQLIGNGFRLYQKVVASVMSQDKEEFSKALGDPLYARIREALYSTSSGELPQVARIHPAEDLVESKKGEVKVANNVVPSATNATVLENSETFGEIVELGKEEIVESVENNVKANDIPNDKVGGVAQNGKRGVYIRSEVEQALETLDKAISMVREYRLRSPIVTSSFANEESPCMKKYGRVDSFSIKTVKPCDQNEVSVSSYSLENGGILDQSTRRSNKQLNTDLVQGISSDDKGKSRMKKKTNAVLNQGMSSNKPKKLSRHRKYLCCSFPH